MRPAAPHCPCAPGTCGRGEVLTRFQTQVECAAAVLLACKSGEVARKVRDVVNVTHLRGSSSSQPIQVCLLALFEFNSGSS